MPRGCKHHFLIWRLASTSSSVCKQAWWGGPDAKPTASSVHCWDLVLLSERGRMFVILHVKKKSNAGVPLRAFAPYSRHIRCGLFILFQSLIICDFRQVRADARWIFFFTVSTVQFKGSEHQGCRGQAARTSAQRRATCYGRTS